jgi:hypothetical protein
MQWGSKFLQRQGPGAQGVQVRTMWVTSKWSASSCSRFWSGCANVVGGVLKSNVGVGTVGTPCALLSKI